MSDLAPLLDRLNLVHLHAQATQAHFQQLREEPQLEARWRQVTTDLLTLQDELRRLLRASEPG
jgi:hypothetical protein